mgnify:CR=1 FL=1
MQRFAIVNVEGCALTNEDRELIQHPGVAGIILFARNYENHAQLRALTADINKTRDSLFITVDQEGGRVRRLRPPHWPDYPSAQKLARVYDFDRRKGLRVCYLHHRLMAHDLRRIGITADCAPVLDLPVEGADPIISDRAFGSTTGAITATLGSRWDADRGTVTAWPVDAPDDPRHARPARPSRRLPPPIAPPRDIAGGGRVLKDAGEGAEAILELLDEIGLR